MVYAETKECGNSSIQSPRKPPQVPQKEEEQPYSRLSTASPPPPLRMERGVNSIVCKQRGRFLDVKEASLQCDGTPPLIEQTAR